MPKKSTKPAAPTATAVHEISKPGFQNSPLQDWEHANLAQLVARLGTVCFNALGKKFTIAEAK